MSHISIVIIDDVWSFLMTSFNLAKYLTPLLTIFKSLTPLILWLIFYMGDENRIKQL